MAAFWIGAGNPMYGHDPRRRAQNFLFGSGIPVTMTLIAANVVTFLVGFFAGMRRPEAGPFSWLVFADDRWPQLFWTVVTWPLVASPYDLIGLLFGGLWAYWIGGSLERSWGMRPYLTFLVATAALTALTLWLGGRLLGAGVAAYGLWLAIAAPTIAWCVLNAREVIRLYAVIPIPAPILAWLTVALTWFQVSMSGRHPLLGAFALSGCAFAYWYAKNGRYRTAGGGGAFRSGGGGGSAFTSGARFGGLRPGTGGGDPPLRFRDFDRDPPVARGFSVKRWLDDRKQRRELDKLWKRSNHPDARPGADPDEKNKGHR
jgi:hypothetical protein